MKLACFIQEFKQLITLAIPMAIAEAAAMGMAFCDAIYAAHASIDDLAGVSLGAAFWSPLIVFSFGALIIIATYAARHIGANKTQHLDKSLQSGLRLAICWGLLLSALLFCSHWLMPYFSLSEKAQQVASSYIMWLSPALFLWTLFTALTLFAEGIGQVKLPMIIAIIGLAFNALANYLLVFGFWFIPAQGGVGCAYATSLTAILMLVCFVICIKNPNYSRHQLLKKYYRIPFSEIKKLLLKGLPAGIGAMSENLIFVSVALILAATSTQAVAANQMVRTFYEVIFVLIFALSQAVTIRTATAIGSNNSKLIRRCINTGIYSTLSIAMLLALGLYTGASFIIGLYTDDLNTASLANSIMLISAFLLLPDSFQYVMLAIMRAYHDIKIPYLLFTACGWLIALPLGLVLCYSNYLSPAPMGPVGLWYGILIGLSVACLALWLRFKLHTQNIRCHKDQAQLVAELSV
ncbi:MATE family efflux transporter [Dasania sp. GY-MA-18]|uniref:Multidrug-efflux transporter n=1 Tax=Dasania phycosphaerae TaxID=2950436 RepID=A0A9J6RH66_9GAMM|nr:MULTISPECIES: MATE family efflux transporter [Dasania]MCR8921196.1 MATE family efflux transporter [Dasania sp. GY-MA-18]MCZ0863624.1 MATE family efflux transporter [Dasania phycosphaerae]MCZ0867352.1 MATE family efflux transporter [Dasania phycosphaerae]